MAFRIITVPLDCPSLARKTRLCARGWRIDTDCKSFIQLIEWSRIMLPNLSSLKRFIWEFTEMTERKTHGD
jgi:hypothetical protein